MYIGTMILEILGRLLTLARESTQITMKYCQFGLSYTNLYEITIVCMRDKKGSSEDE